MFLKSIIIGLSEYSRCMSFDHPYSHERHLHGHLRYFPWIMDECYFKAWKQGRAVTNRDYNEPGTLRGTPGVADTRREELCYRLINHLYPDKLDRETVVRHSRVIGYGSGLDDCFTKLREEFPQLGSLTLGGEVNFYDAFEEAMKGTMKTTAAERLADEDTQRLWRSLGGRPLNWKEDVDDLGETCLVETLSPTGGESIKLDDSHVGDPSVWFFLHDLRFLGVCLVLFKRRV